MNFSTGVSRAVTLTKAASASQGNLAITFTSLGGSSTTQIASNGTINLGIINGATAAAASGNIGGVQHFSAPPHALYMNYDNTAQGYPYQLIMKGCTDESTFVGLPTRRETSSGFTNSIKFCPDTRGVGGKIIAQTTVDGFTSSRAEGGAVLLPQGFGAAINGINTTVGGGRLINSTFSYDSSIVTLDGGVTIPALSLTGGLPTCNVTIDNNVLIDRAAVPAEYPPFTGSSVATSNNVVISNNTQYMNNWDNGYFPYIQFEGNNIQCVGNRFHLNTHSDTQTSRGVFFTQSPSINTQSKFEAVVAGWRLIPIVFNHTIPGQSTLSTLTLAANWPYANATGLLTFLDNETRWVSFSTGSNVVTVLTSLFNQTALTNTSGISVSMTNGSANISGNNSFVVNDQMMFSTTVGTSGGQVVPSTVYYVVAATYNTFQVSATMGGTAITFNASSNPTSPPTAQFMPATGHTFQGMCIGYNRIAYQMRCGFSPGTNGTRATLEDLTNNIVYTFDNNMITAVQTLYMTFTPPSGTTSFTLAPTIENGDWVIDATLYMNTGAAVSSGNISLGYVGDPTAFIQSMTGTGTTGASAQMSVPSVNMTSSASMVVATTGTFTGAGSLVASIRCAYSLTGT